MVNGQELIKPQKKTKTDHEQLCEDCRRGNLENVQNRLQNSKLKPGDIDTVKDAAGYSPIHLAALSGNVDLVNLLVSCAKANPNLQTDSGETPILLAATKGNSQVVSLLLDLGASVDPIPTLGLTPLHIAAGTITDNTVIEKMLEKGAAPLIKDLDGQLAEKYALGADNNTTYEFLREKVELPPDKPEKTKFRETLTRSTVNQMWLCNNPYLLRMAAAFRPT
jgi:ankyrin repeat protein